MLVTFEPTGENVQVGLGEATPQKLSGISSNPIYITVPSGYVMQGSLTTGSSAAYPLLGQGAGFYIGFYAGDNKTLLVTKFKMDDETAATTGLATLAAALAAGTDAITLKSNGDLGS